MNGTGKCNASTSIKNDTILRRLYERPNPIVPGEKNRVPFEHIEFHESFNVGRALMSGMVRGFHSTESVWNEDVRAAYRITTGKEPPPEADLPTQYREWHSVLETSSFEDAVRSRFLS